MGMTWKELLTKGEGTLTAGEAKTLASQCRMDETAQGKADQAVKDAADAKAEILKTLEDYALKSDVDALLVVLALGIQCFGLLLGIAQTSEDVQFPTGCDWQRVCLCRFPTVETADRSLRGKCERRKESKFCRH